MRSRRFVHSTVLAALLGIGTAMAASAVVILPPSNLVAIAVSETQIDLTWADTSSNEGGFYVERSLSPTSGFVRIAKTRANRPIYKSSNLSAATTYYHRVQAFRKGYTSSDYSNVASAMTLGTDLAAPSVPGGVTATVMGCSQIDVAWSPSTDAGSGLAGYLLYRNGSVLASTVLTSYNDTGLAALVSHSYNVVSFDNAGNHSSMSSPVSATTTACSSLEQPPIAQAGQDQTGPTLVGLSFNGSASSDPDGTVVSLSWDFGDGASAAGSTVTHAFASAGTYTVTLTVTDNSGLTGTDSAVVTVTNRSPVASSGADQSTTTGTTVWVSGATSTDADGTIVSYAWTFGDGQSGSGINAPHVYNAAGTYTVTLTVSDNLGATGSDTATVSVASAPTAPNAPTSLSAAPASSSQLNLVWSDNSTNEQGFKVERASSSSGPWTQIGTTSASSFEDSGLSESTTCFYRVRAYNTIGDSAYSNTGSATTPATIPSAPANLTAAAASSSQINLGWTDNSTNEQGFKVERASSSSGPWTQIWTSAANVGTYSDTGLAASTAYYYRVRAYNTAGGSIYTGIASATTQAAAPTIPATPSSLIATAASSGQINLTWSDLSSNETGFKIERAPASTGPWTQIALTGSNASGYSDVSVLASTTNYYRVRATNTAGDSAYSAMANATTPAAPDLTAPTVPTGLSAHQASVCTQLDLSWLASTDTGGSGLKGYNVYRGGVFLKQVLAPAVATSDTGLSGATLYSYNVSAIDNAGNESALTLPASLTTIACSASGSTVWSKRFGGTNSDTGSVVATDTNGNIILTGSLIGAASFGGASLTSAGGTDFWVAKYSSSGAPIWSTRFGGTSNDKVNSIAVDPSGNVWLVGSFNGSVNFGGGVLTSSGQGDVFTLKISGADGSYQFSNRFGSSGNDLGLGIAVDGGGNVIITGAFVTTITFGGTTLNTLAWGDTDLFIAKFNSSGQHVWSQSFPHFGAAAGTAVAADSLGNVALTGYYYGTVSFGPSCPALSASGGDVEDAFVAKFNSSGACAWSRTFGDYLGERGSDVAIDPSGNVLATGRFGPVAVDFGLGLVSPLGGYDNFLVKLAGNTGATQWAKSVGTTFSGDGNARVSSDASGNAVMTGCFGGATITQSAIFVEKRAASDGRAVWSRTFGGANNDSGSDVTVAPNGDVVATGFFYDAVDFGAGLLTSDGSADTYLFRLTP